VILHGELTVFDLVYRPRATALLRHARASGCRAVEGVEMLVEQGARSFEIWTGVRAPVEVMRDAALEALEERAGV
jgi:shikimate dehydrogenase